MKRAGRKRARGFTLIELLIVMLIISILAGVVIMATVGGVLENAKEQAYATLRHQIQDAVIEHMSDHTGELPPTVGTVNISGNKSILDMCSLITPGGMLRTAPEGCILINGSNNDNCDGGNCSGCVVSWHYIWAIDQQGNVFSACVGPDCAANNMTGYQDVWP
jgi:prepilin-type N-terminal cleavage/methylation domain-containing protein